jgi:hypothetical protein
MSKLKELYEALPENREAEHRRGDDRKAIDRLVSLEVEVNGKKIMIARLANVSSNSIGIVTDRPVPERTEAVVVIDGERYEGATIHCTQTIGGYKVGIRVFEP